MVEVKTNYPKVEYSEAGMLHDTKNILYQNLVEKYCKLMQVMPPVWFSGIIKFDVYMFKVFIKKSFLTPYLVPDLIRKKCSG